MIRILIAGGHRLGREGLGALLADAPDIRAVGECPLDALADGVKKHKPDIVILDLEIAAGTCLQTARRLHEQDAALRVVAITGSFSESLAADALAAFVWGLAKKEAGFNALARVIRAVSAGNVCYPPEFPTRHATNDVLPRLGKQRLTRFNRLTPREKELLMLLATGCSLKQACSQLQVSYKTGDKHKANLMRKLDIHDRVELSRFAIRERLIEP